MEPTVFQINALEIVIIGGEIELHDVWLFNTKKGVAEKVVSYDDKIWTS